MFSGRLLSGVGVDVSPRQELVELAHGMTVGDFGEDVGEISLRIDVVHFGGLCRPPNYAEFGRFPQISC